MEKYIPTYFDENDVEQNYLKLEEVWPDLAAFQADLAVFFPDNHIVNLTAMNAVYFIEWLFNGITDAFADSYIAYETEAKFLAHFMKTFANWAPWGFKGFQVYADKLDPLKAASSVLVTDIIGKTVNRDESIKKTGTDTTERTGTDTTVRTGTDTLGKTGTVNKFDKNAQTPTDMTPASSFVNAYTDSQSNSTITNATTDTQTKNLTDASTKDLSDVNTKDLTDTIAEDVSETSKRTTDLFEAIEKMNSIPPSLMAVLVEKLSKHFTTLYVI